MNLCVMCGAHPKDADFDKVSDQAVLDAAEEIVALYNQLRELQRAQDVPVDPTETQIVKGGICSYCNGPTTYTRQNDGRGCLKCETERKK